MFKTIYMKEMREHLTTFRFGAALVTTFVLVLSSMYMLSADYIKRRDTYNISAQKQNEDMIRLCYAPSSVLPIISRAPSPLRIFSIGEDRRHGNFVPIHRHHFPRRAIDSISANEIMESFTSFDLETVFASILSLFGIMLSYDSICREKVNGTLKLLSSTLVKRSTLYLAKTASLLTTIAIPLLFSVIAGLLVVDNGVSLHFSQEEYLGIGLMLVSGLLYSYIFVAIGMLCSSLVHKPATSLLLGLFVWTLLVYIVPVASNHIAELVIETPPEEEITRFVQSETRRVESAYLEFTKTIPPTTHFVSPSYIYSENVYMMDANPTGFRWLSRAIPQVERLNQEKAENIGKLVIAHEKKQLEQRDFAILFALISPVTHLKMTMNSIARTGSDDYYQFLQNVRKYRVQFLNNLRSLGYFDKNIVNFISPISKKDAFNEEAYAKRFANYDNNGVGLNRFTTTEFKKLILPFNYDTVTPDYMATITPLTTLAIMFLFLFFCGFLVFNHYDVR